MGNTCTVNANVFKVLSDCIAPGAGDPQDGQYYALEPYGSAPRVGAPEYEELPVTFPGVDGVGVKRLGFRGRDIWMTVVFIGATKAAVEAAYGPVLTSLTQLARYTITMPGGTAYQGCKLIKGGGRLIRWETSTKVIAIFELDFRQLSVTN